MGMGIKEMKGSQVKVGDIRKNNEGLEYQVIDYKDAKNVSIRFLESPYERVVTVSNIFGGKIKNPNNPSVYGVGFVGEGVPPKENRKIYNIWATMLERCYSEEHNRKYPSYMKCYSQQEWYNFQNFLSWYKQQVGFSDDWHLDKDILVKGNKIYGPDTCCLVPQEINSLFIVFGRRYRVSPLGVRYRPQGLNYSAQLGKNGKQEYLGVYATSEEAFLAYKVAKELHIKETANKWKLVIPKTVYDAMLAYDITIDM